MKNYVKIMREMLKRRQFIFGKQNINRHQPYLDDVVINISDEGNSIPEAIMKFAPMKEQVIDIIKDSYPPDTAVFNISEEDVEFVDILLYGYIDTYPIDYIGYVYKLTKGSITFNGNSFDLSDAHIICAGPVLALDGNAAFVTTRESTEEDQLYIRHIFGPDGDSSYSDLPISPDESIKTIVANFDPDNIGVPITLLPDPSYIVNITTDVLPHIIDHIHLHWEKDPK